MKADIFQEGRKSIPTNDPKVERIEWDKEDLGARKSHISGVHRKNSYSIVHVNK